MQPGRTYVFDVSSNNAPGYANAPVEWTILQQAYLKGKIVFPRRVGLAGGKSSYVHFLSKDISGVSIIAIQKVHDAEPVQLPAPLYYLRFPLKVGTAWEGVMYLPDGRRIPITSTIETLDDVVTVPAGTFQHCVRVRSTGENQDGALEDLNWYAPNIGLIKFVRQERNSRTHEAVEVNTQLRSYK